MYAWRLSLKRLAVRRLEARRLSSLDTADAVVEDVGDELEVVEVFQLSGSIVSQNDSQKGERVGDVVGEVAVGEVHCIGGEVAVIRIVGRQRFFDDLQDGERIIDELFHLFSFQKKERKK